MAWIAWIVLGLIAGFIASQIVDDPREGFVADGLVGISGGVLGGLAFNAASAGSVGGFSVGSVLGSVLCASLLLRLFHELAKDQGPMAR